MKFLEFVLYLLCAVFAVAFGLMQSPLGGASVLTLLLFVLVSKFNTNKEMELKLKTFGKAVGATVALSMLIDKASCCCEKEDSEAEDKEDIKVKEEKPKRAKKAKKNTEVE